MKTILASIDFSDVSTTVVEMAGALARAFQSKLYIMHVAEEVQPEATESGPGILSLCWRATIFLRKTGKSSRNGSGASNRRDCSNRGS